MSFLSGRKSTDQPTYTGVPIQASVWTLPIAIYWGTCLAAGNMIGYYDFNKTTKSQSGGKGGVVGKGGGSVDYTATILLGLCEGPIAVAKVAKDGTSWETLANAGYTLISGTATQAPWSYMLSNHASQALAYPNVAYLVAANYDLGSTPQVPSQNVVINGLLGSTASWAVTDTALNADMALVIQDFLTNGTYGVQGFDSAAINSATLLSTSAAPTTGDNSLQTFCRAMGWGFSIGCSSTETASSILQRWLQVCFCEAVWSGKALKFIPYGDAQITANGVTYLPNLTPIYDLTDADFLGDDQADPILINRADPTDTPNILRLEVTSDDGFYSGYPVEARDQQSIETYGVKVGSSITAHEICGAAQGQVIANLWLQRGLNIRNTYVFKLPWTFFLLEAMDLVTITDPILPGGTVVVMLVSVEEDDTGDLTVTAEDFPVGIAGPTEYATQTTGNSILNKTAVPSSINPPIIFEPPLLLTGTPQVWIVISGGTAGVADPLWGGADLQISSDNVQYDDLGNLTQPARQGILAAGLAAYSGTNPDMTNTLTVDLSMSAGVLVSTNTLNAMAAQTLCYVDGELLSYTTATLVGANTYALTGLYRGLYGTAASSHASGGQFARLDDAIYTYPLPSQYIGHEIYVKAASFNIFGQGQQTIAAATAYEYLPFGGGSGGADMSIAAYSGFNVALGLM